MAQLVRHEWNPGLENDGRTLQDMYDSLPELPPEDDRLSKDLLKKSSALSNSMSLFELDCLHIILGRGWLAQDEAFVLGFTMGTATTLKNWKAGIFRLVAKRCYPGLYQFTENDMRAFNLGVELGHLSPVRELYAYNFKEQLGNTLGEIREDLGISKTTLSRAYRKEREILSTSQASKRLPL